VICTGEAAGALCAETGARVQHARKRQGWTQLDLARAVGMTRSSIANLETGRQRPPVHIVLLIARVLDVPVTDLLPSGRDPSKIIEEKGPRIPGRQARAGRADLQPLAPGQGADSTDEAPASYSEEALRKLYTGIGAKVRRTRNRRAWTQLELAQAVGLSRYSITNVEAGRQRPPVHMALLIAGALDVPVDELLPSEPELEKLAVNAGRGS
jgi:transcriptional regulator with XRE-family HTH domain